MTKVTIISGFLGAGKTTLIKKLLAEAYCGEKLVLIENEFGEISIDGGFLKDSGVQISEMSSGCICCSLVGDFGQALQDVQKQFSPDRILIEPSGVGKLSDVIRAVQAVSAEHPELQLSSFATVADAGKCKVYMKNFGEFFNNQIESAGTIILSRSQKLTPEKLEASVALLRERNPSATIITTPWDELNGKQILEAMEKTASFLDFLKPDEEDDDCCCHDHDEHEHHHDHDEHEHPHDHDEHEHHHDHDEHEHPHDHDEHEHPHDHDEQEHHHDHDEHEHHHDDCCHHDHAHHHADEVFTSWGRETPKLFTESGVRQMLAALDSGDYGKILRAKGIVPAQGGTWLHFDYVPEEYEVRSGTAEVTGRLCVIGAELKENKLAELFGI